MIEVEGLTKNYRKGESITEVLRGATFRIEAGEYVAIMGPSGSGKSTLMNILGFLDRPDSGAYRFEGQDLSVADDDRLSAVRNRRIGFVFQQFHLLDRATALQNVTLPLLYAEGDIGDVEARGRAALESVGLGHRLHHLPGEMSGGEQQRAEASLNQRLRREHNPQPITAVAVKQDNSRTVARWHVPAVEPDTVTAR